MDSVGWMIANLHRMLGHDKAAAVLGVDPWPFGREVACMLCTYEADPTPENKAAAEAATGPKEETDA